MTTRLRQILTLLLLVPQLAVAGLGDGLVLCFAPGDHFQIELVGSLCCADELSSSDPAADAELDGDNPAVPEECPSCEDVTVTVDPMRPDRESAEVSIPHPIPAPGLFVGDACGEVRRADSCGRPRAGAHLSRLRTTVLRC